VIIAAASDLHGTYRDVHFPPADVLILAGDITRHGTLAEIAQLGHWLRDLPYAAKIVISGNHDFAMQEHEARTRRLLAPAVYLRDESAIVHGRCFYGTPWVTPYRGAFNKPPDELVATWAAIPEATHVLVTHMPPHRVCDVGSDGRNLGDPGLLARVNALPRLRAHVFGHIHESHGRERAGATLFANVAICDRRAVPVRPVTLIDL
jgi:Icc-related predicted phosphoesterase